MNPILIEDQQLARRIDFLIEIDRLKHVLRRTYLPGSDRRENTAEHSWHLALAALVLADYAEEPVDMSRVLSMALVHDIVEIDAGDTFFYDPAGALDKVEREQLAAGRIFGLLPPDQAAELRTLWDEFEDRQTPEARFAYALDRFMPLLHNYLTGGRPWRQHGVRGEQVMTMTDNIAPGSAAVAAFARDLVADAMARGYFDELKDDLYDA
jgi:putative hydrolase of HD superfamily